MSLPNQNSADGGFNRRSGATICGSVVAIHGANTANSTIASNTTPPAIAVGCRRNASLKRRHVGDTDLTGASSAIAVTSVPYARIEKHVTKIYRKIDEHVRAREKQDDALNDRIVAS